MKKRRFDPLQKSGTGTCPAYPIFRCRTRPRNGYLACIVLQNDHAGYVERVHSDGIKGSIGVLWKGWWWLPINLARCSGTFVAVMNDLCSGRGQYKAKPTRRPVIASSPKPKQNNTKLIRQEITERATSLPELSNKVSLIHEAARGFERVHHFPHLYIRSKRRKVHVEFKSHLSSPILGGRSPDVG